MKRCTATSLFIILFLATATVGFAHPIEGSTVVLAWDPSPDPTIVGYNVYRSESLGTFSVAPLNSSLVRSTAFTDATGEWNRTYYYVVTAVNSAGLESAPSVTVEAFPTLPVFVSLPETFSQQAPSDVYAVPAEVQPPAPASLYTPVVDDGLKSGTGTVSGGTLSPGSDITLYGDGETAATETTVAFVPVDPPTGGSSAMKISLMDYTHNKALVSRAAFQSGPSIQSGRLYAVVQDTRNTGIAFSNPHAQPVVISFNLVDEAGVVLHNGQLVLPPRGKKSTFLSESPLRPNLPLDLSRIRSFTFSASAPIAAAAVRTLTNQNGDFLMTALPIADLTHPTVPPTLPFYADGAGWQSEIQLVNPTDSTLTGTVQLFPSLNGSGPDFTYNIPARSAVSLRTPGTGLQTRTGWVQVTPSDGGANPVGSLTLTNTVNGLTTSLGTIVSTTPSAPFTVYVETSGPSRGQPGSSETAFSIANPASAPATVSLELLTMNSQSTGRRATVTIDALSNATLQLNQIPGMEGINAPFEGILKIGGAPVSVAGLLMRYGGAGQVAVTPLPAIAGGAPLRSASEPWFLFTAQGGGVSTQLKYAQPVTSTD